MHTGYDPSLNCFFNALLREWPHWDYVGADRAEIPAERPVAGFFRTADDGRGETLAVPCTFFAAAGRHGLAGPCLLGDGEGWRPVPFLDAAAWVLRHPELAKHAPAKAREALLERVRESDGNLREAVEHLGARVEALFGGPLGFVEAESALIAGHSVHPCPKARDAFTGEDARRYAPEYGAAFALAWYRVKRRALYERAAGGVRLEGAVAELLEAEPEGARWRAETAEDEVLVPCHPYQRRVWERHPWLREMERGGSLRWVGFGREGWRATSSVRAVHSGAVPWMLKFSLSVKLTNSLRHLQPQELVRGAELCRVLESPPARTLFTRYPDFRVLREPLSLGIRGPGGLPLPETMVLWRENPFLEGAGGQHEVLATLLQDHPATGESRLARRLRAAAGEPERAAVEWFDRYLDVVLEPLLVAQADYGLLFGAHQQNLVLELDGVQPRGVLFRDCQGTGFSELGRRLYEPYVPGLAADGAILLPDDDAARVFGYYLFVNATFNVVASLAAAGLAEEAALLRMLRDRLLRVRARGVRDAGCIGYLLESPTLVSKGNFMCSIRHLNENTARDFMALYHPIPNPLAAA